MNSSTSGPRPTRAGHVRRATTITLALFAYYSLTMGGRHYSIDGIIVFQAARNWVVRQSFFFDPLFRWGNNVPETSKYGVGLSASYLPVLLPLYWANPALLEPVADLSTEFNPRLLENDLYLYASIIHPIIGALTGLGVYLLGRQVRLSDQWAGFAALASGLASPFATYVRFDFAQPLIGLLLVTAAWVALRARQTTSLGAGLMLALVLGYAVLTRFTTVLTLPWVVGLPLLHAHAKPYWSPLTRGQAAMLLWAGAGLGLGVLATLLINAVKFGSPLAFGQSFGFSVTEIPLAVFGLLLSPGRGLFVFFPFALIFVGGWPLVFKRHPTFALLTAVMFLITLGIYSMWEAWWGGATWGPRYFVPLAPFLTLCGVMWLEQQHRRASRARWIGVGLVVLSLIISLNGILFNFLDFYSGYWAKNGFGSIGTAAQEQLRWAASPLFAGWRFAADPQAYDLYWLKQIVGGSRRARLLVVALVVAFLGASLHVLAPFFRRGARGPAEQR